MIEVTRLDGSTLYLNADLIETVQQTPDTVIGLSGGDTLIVQEPLAVVVERVMSYQRAIRESSGGAAGHNLGATARGAAA
jgi:flagellar protein FlbD